MFARLARVVVARPWWVIAAWVVAAAAILLTAPALGSVTNSDQSDFLPEGTESVRAAALAQQAFPDASSGSSGVVVITRTDGAPLTDQDLAGLPALVNRLQAERPAALAGLAFDPRAGSVAPGREVALIGAQFTGAPEQAEVQDAVRDLRTHLGSALRGTDLAAGVTGEAAIVVDNKQSISDAEKVVTIATVALIVVLLLLIFRSPLAALLPLLTVGLVLVVSMSLIAAAATAFDFEIGQELPILLTVVLFGIGTDYLLFLLFRYRERLRAGDQPRAAVTAAVERVGEAIFSAAFAVIAAFGALVLATLGFFATLGPGLAIGVAVMLLAALTLAPAVLALLGRRVFWPTKAGVRAPRHTRFAALGRFVARRPAVVLALGVALLGGLAAGVSTLSADYDPIGQLPPDTESAQAFDDLQRGFPAGALQPTNVYLRADRPLTEAEVGGFAQRLAQAPGVAGPAQPRVSADGRVADVPLILAEPPFSPAALDLVEGPLRGAARAAAPPGAEVLVGGQSMAYADVRAATERDLSVVFPVAAVLFVLILAALLRAALAPLYLVALVVLGFAATLGATALAFGGGLSFIIPIIVYLFVTAIGTDYNILMTARLREEIRDGRSRRDAAALAVEHAGPSIAAAALILAGTFGSLLISGVPFFVEIGFAVTLGIVLVSAIVSILLVPAATALAGRAAWWPGRLAGPAIAQDPPDVSEARESASGGLPRR
jgi:RND superfamily putative drug exporter